MSSIRRWLLSLVLVVPPAVRADAQAVRAPDTLLVRSGALTLRALLWRPEGAGPFPAVLFNHGTWPPIRTASGPRADERILDQANALGPVFARHGWVFLYPFRRGVGLSVGEGVHAGDLMASALASEGRAARDRVQLETLEGGELADAWAALGALRARADVDPRRIAVVGHSFGGSLTLLMAARDSALAAIVSFGGAAASWERSPALRARLLAAIGASTAPTMIVHAANDYSTVPGRALDAELARLGREHRLLMLPAHGATTLEGHNVVHLDPGAWERAVFGFLEAPVRR